MPPRAICRLALGVSPFAKQIHHRQHAKKLSYVPGALPRQHYLENVKEAFRQEAVKQMAQHDSSDQ
jgi:hypothetical protein